MHFECDRCPRSGLLNTAVAVAPLSMVEDLHERGIHFKPLTYNDETCRYSGRRATGVAWIFKALVWLVGSVLRQPTSNIASYSTAEVRADICCAILRGAARMDSD